MSTTVAPAAVDGELPAVRVLDDADRWSLQRLLDGHPYSACVLAARLDAVGSLHPTRLGGELLATVDPSSGDVRAACFVGGSVVPVGGDRTDHAALGRAVADRPRRASELVGESAVLRALWESLGPVWGPARSYRWNQPLLVLDRPVAVVPDPDVRTARSDELDAYVPAAAAMFTEELGVSPFVAGGESAYRGRLVAVIRAGRAFVRTDAHGRVVFKAEIGAVSRHTAQVQGVWVAPELRRHGIATAAMAAVVQEGLRLAPAVSLYVNDYNLAARALYDRLGFAPVGTLASVLF